MTSSSHHKTDERKSYLNGMLTHPLSDQRGVEEEMPKNPEGHLGALRKGGLLPGTAMVWRWQKLVVKVLETDLRTAQKAP